MADNTLSVRAVLNIEGFERGVKKMRRSLNDFQRSDLTAMSASLAKVSAAFTAAGIGAVKMAADVEQLQTSLVSLTGGTEQAAAAMEKLNDFTAKTPFQLEGVAKAFRQLVAAGSSTGEATKQLQFLGDIAATTGSSIEEIAAIFSKVNAKGKVELENLNQLAERGIPIFAALNEKFPELEGNLGAGRVTVAQFNETLAQFAAEGGFAAGAMERLSQTTAGKFSTALDNLKLTIAEIGKELQPLANAILDATIEIAQFVKNNPKIVKFTASFVAFTAAITALTAAITTAILAFTTIGAVIATAAAAAITITGVIAGLGVAYSKVNERVTRYAKTKQLLAEIDKEAADNVKDEIKSLDEQGKKVRELAASYAELAPSSQEAKKVLAQLKDLGVTGIDFDLSGSIDASELQSAVDTFTQALNRDRTVVKLEYQLEVSENSLADAREKVELELGKLQQSINSRLGSGGENAIDLSKYFNFNSGDFDFAGLFKGLKEAGYDSEQQIAAVQQALVQLTDPTTYRFQVFDSFQGLTANIINLKNEIDDLTGAGFFDDSDIVRRLNNIESAFKTRLESAGRISKLFADDTEKEFKRVEEAVEKSVLGVNRELSSLQSRLAELDAARLNQGGSLDLDQEAEYKSLRANIDRLIQLRNDMQATLTAAEYDYTTTVIEEARKRADAREAEYKAAAAAEDNFDRRRRARTEVSGAFGETSLEADFETFLNRAVSARARILELNVEIADIESNDAEGRNLANQIIDLQESIPALKVEAELATEEFEKFDFADRLQNPEEFAVVNDRFLKATRELETQEGLLRERQALQGEYNSTLLIQAKRLSQASQASTTLVNNMGQEFNQAIISGDFSLKGFESTYKRINEEVLRLAARQRTIENQLDIAADTGNFDLYETLLTDKDGLADAKKDMQNLGNLLAQNLINNIKPDFSEIDFDFSQNLISETEKGTRSAELIVEDWRKRLEAIELLNNLGLEGLASKLDKQTPDNFAQLLEQFPEYAEQLRAFQAAANGTADAWGSVATGIAGFFNQLISSVESGTASLADILEATIKKILIQVGALIAAYAILFALTGGASGAFAQSVGGLGKFLQTGLGIPKFAEGGAVFGPTLALVGEKPGSRGEAIVPFEKIGQFVEMVGGNKSSGPVEVYGKIRGRDIELSGRRGGADRSRRF